jgi:hypothetical protein
VDALSAIGYSALYVGAVMLAVDAAIRNSEELKKRAPVFFSGMVWGFLPLILLSIFGAIKVTQALSLSSKSTFLTKNRCAAYTVAAHRNSLRGCDHPQVFGRSI